MGKRYLTCRAASDYLCLFLFKVMTKAQPMGKGFIFDLRVAAKENPAAEENIGNESDLIELIQENIDL